MKDATINMDATHSSKIQNIAYKVFKVLLGIGAILGGLSQIFRAEGQVEFFLQLGYPLYFMLILGTWKVLAGIALFVPRFLLVKIAAHAGLFFVTTSAAISHAVSGDAIHIIAPAIVACITVASCILHLKHYGVKLDFPEKKQ